MTKTALILATACIAGAGYTIVHAQSQQPAEPPTAPAAAPATPAPGGSRTIYIPAIIDYAAGATVDNVVRTECQLPQQGAQLLETAGRNAGLNLVRDEEAVKTGKGRVFKVEIISVVSAGNAFTGHRKQVTMRGRLMDGEKEIAVFQQARDSMGGAFAGFKGSCSVLGRCVEALSKDMANWLRTQPM